MKNYIIQTESSDTLKPAPQMPSALFSIETNNKHRIQLILIAVLIVLNVPS